MTMRLIHEQRKQRNRLLRYWNTALVVYLQKLLLVCKTRVMWWTIFAEKWCQTKTRYAMFVDFVKSVQCYTSFPLNSLVCTGEYSYTKSNYFSPIWLRLCCAEHQVADGYTCIIHRAIGFKMQHITHCIVDETNEADTKKGTRISFLQNIYIA